MAAVSAGPERTISRGSARVDRRHRHPLIDLITMRPDGKVQRTASSSRPSQPSGTGQCEFLDYTGFLSSCSVGQHRMRKAEFVTTKYPGLTQPSSLHNKARESAR